MKRILHFALPFAAAVFLAGGAAQEDPVRPVVPGEQPKDILEVIAARPELSLFAEAIKASGLDATLRRRGPWTVFAPSNDAFRALPEGTMTKWSKPENRGILSEVISYHMIRGNVEIAEVSTEEMTTLQGSKLVMKNTDGILWVGRGEVLHGDLQATNGTVHVINVVLEPDVQ